MGDVNHVNTNNEVKEEKEKFLDGEAKMEKILQKKKEVDDYFDSVPHDDTRCGIGCCQGPFLQRFANKKAYVFLYGVLGCIFSASYAYSTGTITTIEKRFKIPSRNTGKYL